MFVLLLLLLLGIFQWIPSNGLLNTSSGIYLGRTVRYQNLLVEQYLGIEYARIIRRFDRAQVIRRDENSSIINATTFGSICKPTISVCANNTNSCTVSYGIFTSKFSADEQCLYLNVFLPKKSQEKKSIFMWIHGGSSQIGTGNLFDGTILAALGNIIVITFNFRLNLFGFLSSGDERLEGNLGLYDQSLVLDWIYENSEALGGDKQRITIGGHSAGAPHAYYLAKSRFNQGRIRRLILQSGCPLNIWSHIQANQAIDRFNVVVHDNQCGTMGTFDEKMQCLRERDYLSIVEHEYHAFTSANHTNVVIHGDLMNGFRENQSLPDVDILIGANDDEGAYVAVVPILMESESQDTIMLHNVNYTELSLKFLAAMQPDKTCLHHEALQLYVFVFLI